MSSISVSYETALSHFSSSFVPGASVDQIAKFEGTIRAILALNAKKEAYLESGGPLLRPAIVTPDGRKIIVWDEKVIGAGTSKICVLGVDLISGGYFVVSRINKEREEGDRGIFRREISLLQQHDGKYGLPKLIASVSCPSLSSPDKESERMVTAWNSLGDFDKALNENPDILQRIESKRVLFEALIQHVAGLHAAGLLHQDIKPQNVFLNYSGSLEVLLGDPAYLIHHPWLPGEMTLCGSPLYIPPELASACLDYFDPDATQERSSQAGFAWIKNNSFKRDVWALGVTLLHLFKPENLCWGPKVRAQVNGKWEVKSAPFLEAFRWLVSLNSQSQLFLEVEKDTPLDLVRKMLQIDPRNRPDMNEVLQTVTRLKQMSKLTKENFETSLKPAHPHVLIPRLNWEFYNDIVAKLESIPNMKWDENALHELAWHIFTSRQRKEVGFVEEEIDCPESRGVPSVVAKVAKRLSLLAPHKSYSRREWQEQARTVVSFQAEDTKSVEYVIDSEIRTLIAVFPVPKFPSGWKLALLNPQAEYLEVLNAGSGAPQTVTPPTPSMDAQGIDIYSGELHTFGYFYQAWEQAKKDAAAKPMADECKRAQ